MGESVGGPRRVAADEGHVGIDETATVEGTDPGAGRSDASVAVRPDVASDRFAPGRTRLVAGRVRPSGCVRGPIPPGASVAAPTDTAREDLEALDAAARVADCALAEITVQLAAMRELLLETFDHPVGRSGGTADPTGDRSDVESPSPERPRRAGFVRLADEINRIARNTELAGRRLIDGSLAGPEALRVEATAATDEVPSLPVVLAITDHRAGALGLLDLDPETPGALAAVERAVLAVSRSRVALRRVCDACAERLRRHGVVFENRHAAALRGRDAQAAVALAERIHARLRTHPAAGFSAHTRPDPVRVSRLLAEDAASID